jgi:hypothetical protein
MLLPFVLNGQVMLVDMRDYSTKTMDLPEDPSNPGESTAAVRSHYSQRPISAGILPEGHMVALVAGQLLEQVHVIDMGKGDSPLEDAHLLYDVDSIEGALPSIVFVPKASRTTTSAPVQQRSASLGLLEAANQRVSHLEGLMKVVEERLWGKDLSDNFWVRLLLPKGCTSMGIHEFVKRYFSRAVHNSSWINSWCCNLLVTLCLCVPTGICG